MKDRELKILTKRIKSIVFNPGIVRIKSIIRDVNSNANKEKLNIDQRIEMLQQQLDLRLKDIIVRDNDQISITKKGFQRVNTEENKDIEFNENLELFSMLLIDEYKKRLSREIKSGRTWNIKQYHFEEELLNSNEKLSLRKELKLMFLIEAEKKHKQEWVLEATTKYVKERLFKNKNEDEILFKSKKIEIKVSFKKSKVVLIDNDKNVYERSFHMQELPLFKNVVEMLFN